MAKRPEPATSPYPGVKPGPTDIVEIVSSDEKWSSFTLDDGTKLRAKATVIDVRRARGQFSANGDPLYVFKAGVLVSTLAPAKLRQNIGGPKKPRRRKATKRKSASKAR